ncbi:BON domain-containing protein [Solimonas soli]|uniref:BON domain-containing protein n=1 Tax=Solimonas soli TaxID=413479 RepID=UPI0004B5BCBB|nr:BON domain-containing protein [Solimonas soli]
MKIPHAASLLAAAALLLCAGAQAGDLRAHPDTVYVRPGTFYTHPLPRSSAEDMAITERVVALLAQDHRLQDETIGVTTVNGVVMLSGHVSSPTRVYRAVELARRVAGVRAVKDDQLEA